MGKNLKFWAFPQLAYSCSHPYNEIEPVCKPRLDISAFHKLVLCNVFFSRRSEYRKKCLCDGSYMWAQISGLVDRKDLNSSWYQLRWEIVTLWSYGIP